MKAIQAIIFTLIILFTACSKRTTQDSMFKGRKFKTKNGVAYDKQFKRKPPSVQYAEGFATDDDPEKAAKKAKKEMEKKKRMSQKARSKHNKKVRTKVKTTKERPSGGGS
ncbi:MAG: hypothetical protein KDD29_08255 [Flavobacteriales bacterium]|nr:hypothetical protein [Flavobacteriales bacterium]MCB9336046.1 hypothetical protein [Flavobacteriales bacterium]